MNWAALLIYALAGQQATLQGFARLDADSLMPGPDSGHFIEADPAVELPFRGQPAQGFSAIVPDGNGGYLALTDNGFGRRDNSADFLLRIYFIRPDFRTAEGGSGGIRIDGFINLSDPQRHLPWPITADREWYDEGGGRWPVDPTLAASRLLTGADLDPESLQRGADGSLWIGDEFGPFLIQLNPDGVVAGPPFALRGLVAKGGIAAGRQRTRPSLPASRGFEGMARSGQWLYPMLEGALSGQAGQLNIYRFDTVSRRFLNRCARRPSHRYRLEPEATAIGAFALATETVGLVLERDSGQGPAALHKKIYRVVLGETDEDGFLVKQEVADLLRIADPHDLNGDGSSQFAFSFHTPEGLVVLDRNTIGLINDNNYPFGRARGADAPEATEFILLETAELW
ncbi:MAG TPA: esterase-like activity of phytase family protein [Xanthomonadales bacterium]|nr:esterase-like activity of phytase family protein [Xanthomonadales bacterium]